MSEIPIEVGGTPGLGSPPCCAATHRAETLGRGREWRRLYDIITARHAVTVLVHAWRRRHDSHGARALAKEAAAHKQALRSIIC